MQTKNLSSIFYIILDDNILYTILNYRRGRIPRTISSLCISIYIYYYGRTIFTSVAIRQPRCFIANTRVYISTENAKQFVSIGHCSCVSYTIYAIKLLASTTDVYVVPHTEVLIYLLLLFRRITRYIYTSAELQYYTHLCSPNTKQRVTAASLGYRNICRYCHVSRIDHRPRDCSLSPSS